MINVEPFETEFNEWYTATAASNRTQPQYDTALAAWSECRARISATMDYQISVLLTEIGRLQADNTRATNDLVEAARIITKYLAEIQNLQERLDPNAPRASVLKPIKGGPNWGEDTLG